MTGTGDNDTFSRPSKDLEGVPAMYASSGKAAAWRGYDAVKPSAACGIPGPGKGPAGGRGKYGSNQKISMPPFLY